MEVVQSVGYNARMHPRRCLSVPILLLSALSLHAAAAPALPGEGLTYELQEIKDPPQRLHWLIVDLTNPRWKTQVSAGGADPDGQGDWQTTLMRPSAVAARERFDIAVNGDFFNVKRDPIAPNFRVDQWATVAGPAMSAGRAWASASNPRPCLVVDQEGKLSIAMHARAPSNATAVIAGNVLLVKDGKPPRFENEARHPRTVVGLDKDAKRLLLLVVEGRNPAKAVGMSYAELSTVLINRGCHHALNLDGGGSTTLVIRDRESRELKVVNSPTDGRERPVASVLGLRYE